jgi:uncharacterized repeat protein (TIGR03803 family)
MRECGKILFTAASIFAALGPEAGHSQTLKTIYSFAGGTDGAYSLGALLFHGGRFYGTTAKGGAGAGTVFTIDPVTGTETVIYSFAGGTDGLTPVGALVYRGGALFGATDGGGNGYGTIFEFKLKPATETVLYRFGSVANDAQNPTGGLIYNSGILYGTSEFGGAGRGTIYAIDPAAQTETVLHAFARGAGGAVPVGTLLYDDGILYGTASLGGKKNGGTIFTFDLTSGTEATLYEFPDDRAGGTIPLTGLIYHDKMFYGATALGGTFNEGTVYKLDPATGDETVLYNFTEGADGASPFADLTYNRGML